MIISLFLSPRRAGLKGSAAALQRIYQYIDNYIEGSPTLSKTPAPKRDDLLKGVALLEALAFELAGYAVDKTELKN